MSMFEMSPDQAAKLRTQLIELTEPHTNGEPVIVAAMFRRGGSTASFAASKAGGGLIYAGVSMLRKKQAGGLPERVILTLTPTKLHAFEWKFKGRKYHIKDEVAVWDRAAVQTSTEQKMGVTMLTIESPAEGEKVTLAPGGVKDDAVGLELISELQGDRPPATA